MPEIELRYEMKRGCGYRKPGGLYLVLPEYNTKPCGKLPLPLDRCPCCGAGIKFTRGWTWIDAKLLFGQKECLNKECLCVLANPPEKMGLIWIGRKFYETPQAWINEAIYMGISRRIKAIPKGFRVGETWVAVAHVEGISGNGDEKGKPAIFQVFKPSTIEYVVRGDETEEQLKKLEESGIRLVKVMPLF